MTEHGGVWCRQCGALEYRTVKTVPAIEGVYRAHVCSICGHKFGSLATVLEGGRLDRHFLALTDCVLPVALSPSREGD